MPGQLRDAFVDHNFDRQKTLHSVAPDHRREYRGGLLSAEQMIAQLTAASQRLGEAHARLQDATKAVGDAQTMVSGALQGSSGQLVAQIRGLIEALVQISASVPKTQEHVQQTITRVKALGN
jgi:hypothetical protein